MLPGKLPMPYGRYRRRYRPRRRRFRRRRGGFSLRGAMSAWRMAQMAWRGVRYIKGLVNAEKHFKETNFTAAISSTGAVTDVTAVPQGDTIQERTGNSIFVRGLHCRGFLTIHGSATTTTVRTIVFIDKQQVSDTAPAVTDVLDSASVNAHLLSNNFGRFQILRDLTTSFSINGDRRKNYQFYIPLRHHVRFNGTAATDSQKGTVYILHLSDQATNTPSHDAECRVYYYDN